MTRAPLANDGKRCNASIDTTRMRSCTFPLLVLPTDCQWYGRLLGFDCRQRHAILNIYAANYQSNSMTRQQLFIAVTLSALSVYLTFSGQGYIIVPTSGSWITVLHLPTILAGILGGWVVGGLVGCVFGVSAMIYAAQSDVAVFADVWVSLPPRILVGLVASVVFGRCVRWGEHVAVLMAAMAGTLTNTILVLTTAVLRGYFSADMAIDVASKHFVLEVSFAAIGTLLLTLIWRALQNTFVKVWQKAGDEVGNAQGK